MRIPLVGKDSIESKDIGFTLIHEHLRAFSEAVRQQWPHLYNEDEEFRNAVNEVKRAMQFGVKTIVDPTVMGLGRDIRFMEKVVKATGINLVAGTGIWIYIDLPFYFLNRSIDEIADLFIHDIKEGIQGTLNKAGFVKIAADEPGITKDVEKVIRAAAIANKETKVPIITHSNAHNNTGLEQQRILTEEGVDPGKILIGHLGDTDNIDYIKKIADKGSFIGLDRYGLDMFLPVDKRNETTLRLIKDGYSDKIMISHDYCCTIDWGTAKPEYKPKLAPRWSITLIFEDTIPFLKRNGVNEEVIATIFKENPKKFFS
uniref:Aryldialkylphosphatase n=1 Tax=Saccharolobus solfataricus TaxID=2287 RepID=UPI000C71C9EE